MEWLDGHSIFLNRRFSARAPGFFASNLIVFRIARLIRAARSVPAGNLFALKHEREDVGVLLAAQAARARSAASKCGSARTDRRS